MIAPYSIVPPSIPSAGVYYFSTDSGVRYEVRFGRKQHDVLCANIVFGVLNEEYEGEEYVLTNKGEFYRVMATVTEVIGLFRESHPTIHTFEFSGEPAAGESDGSDLPTKRTKVFLRYARMIFDRTWTIYQAGNKIMVRKN